MKKTLLFAAAVLAAMTMKAQDDEKIVKYLYDVCNYLDVEAEKENLIDGFDETMVGTTVTTVTSTNWATASNGSVFKGYQKSDESEADAIWNIKAGYKDDRYTPELSAAGVMDTLYTGTMFRGASGTSVELGAFTTTANGKIQVYWQPNGGSSRGISISGINGVFYNEQLIEDADKGCYCAELEIDAGDYYAGDIVITITGNTCNIFGVNIENLKGEDDGEGDDTAISSTMADAGISYNGREILNPQAKSLVVYNVLGKRVAQSNGNISLDGFQSGIYVVRAEGIQQALKIKK